jgi:hypothetical protein
VTLARGADRVFRIDEHGRLELLQTSDNAANGKHDDIILDSANEKAAASTAAGTKALPSPEAKKNSASNVTDRKVYQTYLQSIRRSNMLVFFACAILFAFTLKFPG